MSNKFKGYSPGHQTAHKLDSRFAEISSKQDEKLFCIGFKFYNEKLSKLNGIKTAELKKVIEFFNKIGKCSSCMEFRDNVAQEIKLVKESGHYLKYFPKISEDVELKEFDLGNYRGFFFIQNAEKTLQMIAIDKHPEYKKQKRR